MKISEVYETQAGLQHEVYVCVLQYWGLYYEFGKMVEIINK